MKKSFIHRLNYIHLSHFVFLTLLIFIVNYFVVRSLTIKNRKEYLKEESYKINQLLSGELKRIENAASSYAYILRSGSIDEKFLNKSIELYINTNEIIEAVFLVDSSKNICKQYNNSGVENSIEIFNDLYFKNLSDNYWGSYEDSAGINLFYLKKISDNLTIITFLERNTLEKLISCTDLFHGVISIILDKDFKTILSSGTENDSSKDIIKSLSDGIKLKYNTNFKELSLKHNDKDRHKFFSHTIYNKDYQLYITISQPKNRVVRVLYSYVVFSFLIFLASIILIIGLVVLSNHNLIKPLNELYQKVQGSPYLKLNSSSFKNEIQMIHKSFDLLENQLKLYEQNIEKISKSNLSIENELKIAQRLQHNLLPSLTPNLTKRKEFELYAFSESLFEIGGDFYDYFLIDDNNLLVAVADVSGKGIPASLFMIYTHTLLRSISEPGMMSSEIIEKLNNKLIEENISDMFVTIFLGILKINTGMLQFCNAAHNFPLIIHKEGKINELDNTHGIPIGIYPNRKYQNSSIILNPGDQLFIYTDGLIDTIDENGLKFTVDVLKYNLMGTWFFNTKEVVEKINKSVVNFRGNIKPGDDLTILNLKYMPGSNV